MKTLKESILSSTGTGRLGIKKQIEDCEFTSELVKMLDNKVAFYKVKNPKELKTIIDAYISAAGKSCSLNWIDTSEVTDMSELFSSVATWDFNGDISKWDVSNVTKMTGMFYNSSFNGNISEWDVSNVKNMACMFDNSGFNGNISNWDVSKVRNMSHMFKGSKFNQDISKWNVNKVKKNFDIFIDCPIKENYKPKFIH